MAQPVPEFPRLPQRYSSSGTGRNTGDNSRIAALDGLRGVAIAAVVAFHAGILPGGFLGVDLFFVLSGFLITGLLLHENQRSGTIAVTEFWTRRARRLFPAILVLVAAAQLWARTRAAPEELAVVNGQSAAAMVYASNWFNILFDVGYWDVGPRSSPLNHLWSLAIEEQFYFVFPLLTALLLMRAKLSAKTFAWLLFALAVAFFALIPALYASYGANRAYFGTDSRAGAILLGAALAAWLHKTVVNDKPPESGWRGLAPIPTLLAGGCCVLISVLWVMLTTASPLLYNGGLALHAFACATIIALTTSAPQFVLTRVLQWKPLVWLGERSYSLYLWHWPLMVVLTPASTGLQGFALAAATCGAISVATLVSYELVEKPIRYSALRGQRMAVTFALPAFAIAASALFFQPLPPPQFGSETLLTQGRSGVRLVIAGDSWARKLGMALAAVDSTHNLSILNLGKGGCGITDAKRQRTAAKGEFETSYDCLQWHRTWRSTIEAVRPEFAILNVGNWDQAEQDFDGTGAFVGACSEVFTRRYAQQLDSAVSILGERGARVFVMTVRDNDERAGSGPDCMNRLLREAVARNTSRGVLLLDLYAQLCADHRCPDVVDNEPVYDATGHLSEVAELRIARWVLNSVNGQLRKR